MSRHPETATIIPFLPRKAAAKRQRCDRTDPVPADLAAPRNEREERYRRWRAAEARRSFWNALTDLAHYAYIAARDAELAEAEQYAPLNNNENRIGMVDVARAATAAQLLTPAPTQAALNWKLAQEASGRIHFLPIDRAALARIIEADRAWLAAHKRAARAGRA